MPDNFRALLLLTWVLSLSFVAFSVVPTPMAGGTLGFAIGCLICFIFGVRRYRSRGLWLIIPTLIPITVGVIIVSRSDTNWFVENQQGPYVTAALDIESCEALARRDFELPSDQITADFKAAVLRGGIIRLDNGTNIEQGNVLNYENQHLVPWHPTAPITGEEEIKRHIGVYMWVTPTMGPYKNRKVCVSLAFRYGKYPPAP